MTCEILFPDEGLNPGTLHGEHKGVVTGPPGKSPIAFLFVKEKEFSESSYI